MKKIYLLPILVILACCGSKKTQDKPIDIVAYNSEIEAWHQKRIQDLKGSEGWLNLAGLFWLHEGVNTFGSGPKNDIVFPEGKMPERAGIFLLKQSTVTLEASPGVNITSKGRPVKRMVVFHPDSSKTPTLEYDQLQWFIVERDTKYGIRLRDFKNPELVNFKGIERYPLDAAWRLEAMFEKADSSRTIDITNILGQTAPLSSPGTLVFKVNGEEYRLDAFDGGDEYFTMFGDATNTKETYGAGRYLYLKKPDAQGKIIIDFNQAFNPPCAFTAFATCPLPPKQNILNVEVTAGEKNYGRHH